MVEFISYGKQWIDDDDIDAVVKVLKSDYLTQGPKVEELEKAICEYTGAKYCIAVSNGTAALHLAVACLEVDSGFEGITTPITFVASANCLIYNGITPTFADIDKKTYNIDPDRIKNKVNSKTKVIVAVDFAGQPAELETIYPWARDKKIYVVEDAAHSIGSSYQSGEKVGSCKYSDVTTFSFHPVKTITTGEGGAITTNSEKLYQKLLLLRSHGITKDAKLLSKNPGPWYSEMQDIGFNYRMSDMQAALGLSQLKKIDEFSRRRREIVTKYNQEFSNLENVVVPYEKNINCSVFHLYVLRIAFEKIGKSRLDVFEALKKKNIGTQVHYLPVYQQPYYQENFGYLEADYPESEFYYSQCLSLPLYPKMSAADIEAVVVAVKDVLG